MRLTPGTALGPYEIMALLGAGGMGEVYCARDPRLSREVAIKVLSGHGATDPARLQRFQREARTVAGLNHPNIVVLHSIEEHDGTRFITMELVQGDSLARRIAGGGLPVERILEYAIPIAEALVAAHEKGIVHRDLKPGNVMVSREGRVKVLDFGLAKLMEADGTAIDLSHDATVDAPLSETGTVSGTVPYMAPEQLRGEPPDPRTDLFAFGVILHELASGSRPFVGTSAADVSSSILRDAPPPLRTLRSDLPAELERIVLRCLEKEPRQRYQTALDVLHELRRIGRTDGQQPHAAAAPADQASVAVLPFANRSADPEDEYFSDGLADELINVLVQVPGLHVAARASSFHFKGRNAPIADVGRALRVATVLDGSVRKSGRRARITMQLVKVEDGYHLWSEVYDRTLDDIFAVQDDIARSVVNALRRTLLNDGADAAVDPSAGADVAGIVRGRVGDPEAYDLYLRGRHLLTSSDDGPRRAQDAFRRAIERAPTFAPAYAGLGDAYVLQSWLSSRDRQEVVAQARGALARALALDERLSEAHVLSGQIHMYFEFDWAAAESAFRRAVELNPGSDIAHRELASYLSLVDRTDEALDEARRAQTLDPLSVNATHELGYQLFMLGRLDEAVMEFRRAIDLNPDWIWGNIKLGMTYARKGEEGLALQCAQRADALIGDRHGTPLAEAWLATIELLCGRPDRAHATRSRLLEEGAHGHVDPVALAEITYALGDHDATFAHLEQGLETRAPAMVYMLQSCRFFMDGIARDPRMESLLRRMGFPRPD